MLMDKHGRSVSYLRLSITDKCNLRCFYCQGVRDPLVKHKEILRYEDMEKFLLVAESIGIKKVRLTGGEPFLRRNFWDFLEKLGKEFNNFDFRLTTNGTLIKSKKELLKLKELGFKGLNVSLDTFDKDKFLQITGASYLNQVLQTIFWGLEAGLKIKINAVALKGLNDKELVDFANFAYKYPVDVRFIEFMPIGQKTRWKKEYFWSAQDILRQLTQEVEVLPLDSQEQTAGPARVFQISGGKGRIGVISPLSDHFCERCNRLRITSQGRLRPCLFSDREYKLLALVRNSKLSLKHLEKVISLAIKHKPVGAHLLEKNKNKVCDSAMVGIGG
ncbi:MAG: 3,8-cyclase [Desulfonauticus sp.]|nr:3,8-cyclase [Desulfonauticus sp.]